MGAETVPLTPAPLTIEQARTMAQRQIKKHHVAMMLLHWFNAIVWLTELTTGAALVISSHFRVMPFWYIKIVEGVFGSKANMLRFHIAVGVTWVVVFAVYAIFGYRRYVRTKVLHGMRIHEQPLWRRFLALQCILFQSEEICMDADDLEWLKVRTLHLMKRSQAPLPPQGIYNAGQKLFAWVVYFATPVIMATGIVMSLHLLGTAVVGWAVVLHFAAVGMVVSGLMVHVYMGAVFPEEKPAFFSMITGMVNELYAYRHHFKWWREVKMQEAEWEQTFAAAAEGKPAPGQEGASPPATGAGASGAATSASLFTRLFRQPGYWPPYVAGFGLGLTLLATFLLMGEGLGASGGFTRFIVAFLAWVAPHYAAQSPYWSNYFQPGQSPLIAFLVFELLGVVIGGFVSGWLAGRVRIAVDKGPGISRRLRYGLALSGGILTGFGARLARGCTSGLALSGGAVLAVGAWVFMLAVFAAGFVGAYFMRRYWL